MADKQIKSGRPGNITADRATDRKAGPIGDDQVLEGAAGVRGPPTGEAVDYLLTESEVARRLGGEEKPLSLSALRRWRGMPGCNGLPFVKIGARVRYSTSDVETFIERCKVA